MSLPGNTERFTGRVAVYERYRQRYPAHSILPLLREWCALTPQQTIADIGAGTGMLSEVFLENGNRVIAVEPNADMRTALAALRATHQRLSVQEATAEETGLPDASVDMVSAGRAFHWFDAVRALREFRRILRPGGWIVLVALARARATDGQGAAFEELLVEYGTDYAYVRSGYRVHERLEELFAGGELRQAEIHGEQRLDLDGFIGQTLSYSFAPLVSDERHGRWTRALTQFFHRFAVDGLLTMPTTCWVSCGRLPS